MDIQGIVPRSYVARVYPAQAFEHDRQRTEPQNPLTSLSSSLARLTLSRPKAAAVLRAKSIEQGHLGGKTAMWMRQAGRQLCWDSSPRASALEAFHSRAIQLP